MPTQPARRRRRGAIAAATALSLSLGALVAATPVAAVAASENDDLASRFTFAVLPDTQFYSRYTYDQFAPRYGTNPFAVQTQFLADNADDLRISMVSHLGDIVDRVGVNSEWQAADEAMATLDQADVPYSILAGNHDVRNSRDDIADNQYDLANEPFLKWFGKDRAAQQSTYQGSDATGFSQYHIFEAEGQRFMVLALPWVASDETLEWAAGVLEAHPTVPTILTTHALLHIGDDQTSPVETPRGLRLWDKLISSHDQVFMTLNGHSHGATRLTKTNDYGHEVTEILMDYQMAYEGGNGYMGLFEFDLTNNRIEVQTASPWVTSKPQEKLTSYDQPFLEGVNQRFTIDIDFTDRFSGFNPDFTAGTPDEPSLTQKTREILLDGFDGPDPITTEHPGNADDFVEVPGTLAHWRFNSLDGVVGAETVVPDVSGNGNPLHRGALSGTAKLDDVTIQPGVAHGFSSDGAAVCFANSDRGTQRQSYLTTEQNSPLTNADFTNGYTIETFVKMSADWTADKNQWSKFLTRSGNRSTIPGVPWSQWDYTASPTALGISNLREYQYTSIPAETYKGDKTNWSGEIMTNTWAHVALVNDPATQSTTMYVDGAPVLRNANSTTGMAFNEGMPWILGSDWVDDKATQGWEGCVGETRIIDHATTPDQWLTQRADLSDFTVDQAPADTIASGTAVRFAGTGHAGAEVRLTGLNGATTTVGEDGTWQIETAEGVSTGTHEVSLVQALGSRTSTAVTHSFSVAYGVETSTTSRSIGTNRYLSITATNRETAAVDITIETPYGSKTFVGVKPGKAASVSFNSRQASIGAGTATITVTGIVGGAPVTVSQSTAYSAS